MGTRVGTVGLLLDLKQSITSVEFGLKIKIKIKIKIGAMAPTFNVSRKSYDAPS